MNMTEGASENTPLMRSSSHLDKDAEKLVSKLCLGIAGTVVVVASAALMLALILPMSGPLYDTSAAHSSASFGGGTNTLDAWHSVLPTSPPTPRINQSENVGSDFSTAIPLALLQAEATTSAADADAYFEPLLDALGQSSEKFPINSMKDLSAAMLFNVCIEQTGKPLAASSDNSNGGATKVDVDAMRTCGSELAEYFSGKSFRRSIKMQLKQAKANYKDQKHTLKEFWRSFRTSKEEKRTDEGKKRENKKAQRKVKANQGAKSKKTKKQKREKTVGRVSEAVDMKAPTALFSRSMLSLNQNIAERQSKVNITVVSKDGHPMDVSINANDVAACLDSLGPCMQGCVIQQDTIFGKNHTLVDVDAINQCFSVFSECLIANGEVIPSPTPSPMLPSPQAEMNSDGSAVPSAVPLLSIFPVGLGFKGKINAGLGWHESSQAKDITPHHGHARNDANAHADSDSDAPADSTNSTDINDTSTKKVEISITQKDGTTHLVSIDPTELVRCTRVFKKCMKKNKWKRAPPAQIGQQMTDFDQVEACGKEMEECVNDSVYP